MPTSSGVRPGVGVAGRVIAICVPPAVLSCASAVHRSTTERYTGAESAHVTGVKFSCAETI
jgi:hypothetical protein